MTLPAFRDDGWLPEGHHPATWDEIAAGFGGEPGSRRAAVLFSLLAWRDAVRGKGMGGRLIVDGSFISQKPGPGDFDCIFVYDEASTLLVRQDKEALALVDNAYCKQHYGGDVWAYSEEAVRISPEFCRIDGLDRHKTTLQPKGVLEVEV